MTLTGSPPTYTRGYSFTTHSQQQPNVPQPGDRLDAEYDDIATAVNSYVNSLKALANGDGTLKNGSVGKPQLAPGLFDGIVSDAQGQLQPMLDDAADSAAAAAASAAQAADSASAAGLSASSAESAATQTTDTANLAMAAQATAEGAATDAGDAAAAAANSADTAEAGMNNSLAHSELAFKWAEYLGGPVAPAPPGWPEAIDDGLWSAKWWAVRAREIVGAWGGLYLGAYPQPPFMDPTNPWPPGSLYYDTGLGQILVWNGQQWTATTTAGPSVTGQFVYLATAAQINFTGPDLYGATPAYHASKPEPTDVHVNGVRLQRDLGSGGDYSVNVTTATLTMNQPLIAGSVVQWDLLIHPSQLAPGSVVAFKLADLDRDPTTNDPGQFDGVKTTFPMRYTDPADSIVKPCNPGDGVQVQMSLDGVMQEFGVDFHTQATDMVFIEPPLAGARCWCVWYQPGNPQ